jgi:hypothetical protein
MLDAKAVPTVAYVADGTKYRSKASGNVSESARQEICPREICNCEARYTC